VLTVVVIVHTLGFLPFKDRKTMTSVVSPHLNKFKWVASLWSEIDTRSVPYIPLLNIVLPKLGTKFIKHFTMVFKRVCTSCCQKSINISY
jgi:SET domain-containing protein